MTETIKAEVVVIGSGVAGAVTAWKLASLGVRDIVVLEAGPRITRADIVRNVTTDAYFSPSSCYPNPDHAPRPDWERPENNFIEMTGPAVVHNEYLRVVGGTTWHWDSATPRMHPADFRLRSAYKVGADWPLSYDELEPFYCEAERELGVCGDPDTDDGSPRSQPPPMPPTPFSVCDRYFRDGLKEEGISIIPRTAARATVPYMGRGRCEGFSSCTPICASGAQYTGYYHVERAEKLGVRVIENTRVDRIVADGPVTHVEAQRADGTKVIAKGRIFVLAANGMETPRLLLMSADESHPKGLANASGQVGRNFMDHPAIAARLVLPDPVWPGRGPSGISGSHDFRDGPFRSEHSGWLLRVKNNSHLHEITDRLMSQGVEPPLLDAAIRDAVSREVELEGSVEQLPNPANGITLNWDKRDRAGQPCIRHYYSFSEYEEKGLAHVRETFTRISRRLKAKLLYFTDPFTEHHQMGMAVMGANPASSVVDPHCRAHAHKNLFIIGSAVFPASSCSNPTITIAALALRMAPEIARQLKGK